MFGEASCLSKTLMVVDHRNIIIAEKLGWVNYLYKEMGDIFTYWKYLNIKYCIGLSDNCDYAILKAKRVISYD